MQPGRRRPEPDRVEPVHPRPALPAHLPITARRHRTERSTSAAPTPGQAPPHSLVLQTEVVDDGHLNARERLRRRWLTGAVTSGQTQGRVSKVDTSGAPEGSLHGTRTASAVAWYETRYRLRGRPQQRVSWLVLARDTRGPVEQVGDPSLSDLEIQSLMK
jgi:hypothetical protein